MKKLHFLAAAVLAGSMALAGAAQAAIVVQFTQVSGPGTAVAFTGPGAATLNTPPSPAYRGYLVRLVSNDDPISTVNATFTGPLHQRWTDSDEDTVLEKTVRAASLNNVDSHFVLADADILSAIGTPDESNSLSGSPIATTTTSFYGTGSTLTGNYGLVPAAQTTSRDLAYLVIREDQIAQLSGIATVGTTTSQREVSFNGTIGAVPEPASLSLVGLGVIALLARRRRA